MDVGFGFTQYQLHSIGNSFSCGIGEGGVCDVILKEVSDFRDKM